MSDFATFVVKAREAGREREAEREGDLYDRILLVDSKLIYFSEDTKTRNTSVIKVKKEFITF